MPEKRRLLTIGHSYVVAENRRLAHEMAVVGSDDWDVTVVAPRRYRGDLRTIDFEPIDGEASNARLSAVRWQAMPHLSTYADTSVLTRGRWDVVHCWEEPYVRAGAQIARRVPPGAVFVPATFQNIAKRYPWPLGAFERTTMTRADGWIAFGETVRTALATRDGYGKPVRVIPPGVDVERFVPDRTASAAIRQQLGWQADDCVVGFLGRFVPQKGLPVLVDALERLAVPWRALFVGGGPMEKELRAFASRHAGRVAVTGVPHHEVPRWLNAMTMLCAPSQTTAGWREQFGRMLIEGMACGVPVLASASGEMPAVVADAGVVLPEHDASTWAAAMARLASSPGERLRRSEWGLRRARREYAWPSIARRHLEFFEEILDARGAPRERVQA